MCFCRKCMYLAYNQIYKQLSMLATEKNNDVIEQIKKLVSRIANLHETKMKFFDYSIRMEEMFADNSKTIKSQIEQFQGIIINKSFYSFGKCQNIKMFIATYKDLCLLIQNFSKLNIAEIKKLDIDTSKLEEKIKKKSENFIKIMNEYNSSQLQYNKSHGEYQGQCTKLDDMMKKYKCLFEPINFYNLKTTSDQLKSLDRKYNESENKQAILYSSLQYLDQKRKVISENIKDIKDDYVILLHNHMTNISAATGCLADLSKDEMQNLPLQLKPKESEGDGFIQRIQRFDQKYGKNSSNEEFSDLKELLMSTNQQVEITTDERLFLDRCETFLRKKSQSVEEFIQIQRKLIDQIHQQISNCDKLQKQAVQVQKSIFRSNGADDFKKNIRKYFGQGTLNLVELSFILIDVPKKRLSKIGSKLQSYDEKLKKSVQKKQEQYKKFKKKVTQVLSQHNTASRGVQNNVVSISQFKGNVQKTFSFFKNAYDSFTVEELELDNTFNSTVNEISVFVGTQIKNSLMRYRLNKQKQKFLYNIYRNFNSDTEIIEIVKQDTRYQILFNDSMKPTLATDFKSQIDKKKYEETKKILQKKQAQLRGIIGDKEIGCCGLQKGRVEKFTKIKSHEAKLVCEGQSRKQGKLQILDKGLKFEEKKKNPFSEKTQIIIRTKQILSFVNLNTGGVQILTGMGPILFQSDNYQEIGEDIQKNLGPKLTFKDQNVSKLERSNDSSFFKQNNSSTEYKVSFEKSVITPQTKSNLNKINKPANNDNNAMRKMIESWKKAKLFLDSFVILHFQETANSTRVDYKFQDDLNKFLLKQKRNVKSLNLNSNTLELHYQWKVSFPDMPMLKSFAHGQEVKIDLLPDNVRINITETNRGESHLYVRKTFYNEVTAMNEKLINLIVGACQRQAHVVKNQEPQSQQSTILLDLENLALDKQEVLTKQERVLKRLSSGNQPVESERIDLKDSRATQIK